MIDVLDAAPHQLGECPLWDERLGVLYVIDIDGRCVQRFDPSADAWETRPLAGRPGSIAITPDPTVLLVATEDDIGWLSWGSGAFEDWITVDTGGASNRLNDGAVSRDGRFWVGSMHEDATDTSGLLYRIDGDATVHQERSQVGVPNGLAFSPNGSTMYFADTLRDTVWAFDYDMDSGVAARERVFLDFADLPGRPDGATVDVDGCYWIACVFGNAIARITPAGAVDRVIELPVDKPTKPAFGGTALDVLFVTSIGGGGSHRESARPNGQLIAIDVGVSGLPEPILSASR